MTRSIAHGRRKHLRDLKDQVLEVAVSEIPQALMIWETIGHVLHALALAASSKPGPYKEPAVLLFGILEDIFSEAGVDVNQCHEPPPGVTERVEEWTKLLVRQLIQKVLVLPQRYRDSLDSVFKLINGAITGGPRKPKSSHREMSSRMIEARRRQYRDLRQRIQD